MAGGNRDSTAESKPTVTRRDALRLGVGGVSGIALFADVSALWSSGSAHSSTTTEEGERAVRMRLYRVGDAGGNDAVTVGDTVAIDFRDTELPWETYTSRIRLVHERTQTVKESCRSQDTEGQVLTATLEHPGEWSIIYLTESKTGSLHHEETVTVDEKSAV